MALCIWLGESGKEGSRDRKKKNVLSLVQSGLTTIEAKEDVVMRR